LRQNLKFAKDIIMSQIPHTNITRLVVKNYRSLADIDIGLSPLTVLVGKNAVGKSNVMTIRLIKIKSMGLLSPSCTMSLKMAK